MRKTMVIESVSAFNGMDVLVARDEELFAAEGLNLQFASRQPSELRSSAEGTLEHPLFDHLLGPIVILMYPKRWFVSQAIM
jgi:hypothetical protein